MTRLLLVLGSCWASQVLARPAIRYQAGLTGGPGPADERRRHSGQAQPQQFALTFFIYLFYNIKIIYSKIYLLIYNRNTFELSNIINVSREN